MDPSLKDGRSRSLTNASTNPAWLLVVADRPVEEEVFGVDEVVIEEDSVEEDEVVVDTVGEDGEEDTIRTTNSCSGRDMLSLLVAQSPRPLFVFLVRRKKNFTTKVSIFEVIVVYCFVCSSRSVSFCCTNGDSVTCV